MASNVRRSRGSRKKESASDVARRLSYTGSQDRRQTSARSGFYGSESSADLRRGGPPQHAQRYSHYSDCIANNHMEYYFFFTC